VPPDTRDAVVDFVARWQAQTEIPQQRFAQWLGIGRSKLYRWSQCYGQAHEHNAWIPRDHWLEAWEREAILAFYIAHPLEGYRRLTFMMLDADVVAVSPTTTYRVLRAAGALARWQRPASRKGTGFQQPIAPHEHWHVDLAYVNVAGTFWYLCVVLDGYSRFIVHWELRAAMREADVELVLQRALEQYPGEHPRIISDNGPQFIARDFKEFIRLTGMTHVRTSPYYPQSNGKVERTIKTIKVEGLRPAAPDNVEAARAVIGEVVQYYNTVRLHSAIGYVTPQAKLDGRDQAILAERDRKLEAARQRRAEARATPRATPEPLLVSHG
jgi:putative transposase